MPGAKNGKSADGDKIVGFPQSRVRPRGAAGAYKDLGDSVMVTAYGQPARQATGHWCSRCKGIWFGYLLEVECPVCGSRDG